jgi:1,4-dihydroxy-2-naphthoyl-CoA hydrolase
VLATGPTQVPSAHKAAPAGRVRIKAHPLPFAELLGVEFVSAAPDAVEARMVVRPDLCQFAHGGAIMSFADSLGGAAAFASLPAEAKGTTTLESKTNFIAGAPAGSTLIGRCALIHRGRRTQVWQTRVETVEGKLIALTSQTQMTL